MSFIDMTKTKKNIQPIEIIILTLSALILGVAVGTGLLLLFSLSRKYVRQFYYNIIPCIIFSIITLVAKITQGISIQQFYIYNTIATIILLLYNYAIIKWKNDLKT